MLSIAFIMAFVGVAVALLIGILIFSEVSESINEVVDCSKLSSEEIRADCEQRKEDTANIGWTVVGILPIAMFFILFAVFGGIGGIGGGGDIGKVDTKKVSNYKLVNADTHKCPDCEKNHEHKKRVEEHIEKEKERAKKVKTKPTWVKAPKKEDGTHDY